jgi:hypothetical protein
MDERLGTCPLPQRRLVDAYFLEHRTKILDIAAFMDRLDRSIERNAEDDFRMVAFKQALAALHSGGPGRVEDVQMIFSDPTTGLLDELDQKGASGASPRGGETG